jgi:hypothetical protein
MRHLALSILLAACLGCASGPQEPLQAILDEISPRSAHRLADVPRMADITGLGAFLQGML